MQTAKRAFQDRRQFLINSGWMAAGVTMLASCSPIYSALPALPSTDNPDWAEAVTWIQVLPNGTIRFYCPRMEMGQGAVVGLSQVVAEELNVESNEIECILPNTQDIPRFKMTVGSDSITNFFDPVSRAGAGMREVLRKMAMDKSNFELSEIKDAQGGFLLPDGQRLSYAMLIEDNPKVLREDDIELNGDDLPRYALENQGKYREIGSNWKHHELEAIITGKPIYARDASVPEMLYGQVLRPPSYGAKLLWADGQSAQSVPGVIAVVIDKEIDFVGVVVQHPSQLTAALERIKIGWSKPLSQDQRSLDHSLNVERIREEDEFEHTLVSQGDVSNSEAPSKHQIEGLFETSFADHAAMEPRAAIVAVKKEDAEVWCGSQDPFYVQQRVAKAIGRLASTVIVHPHRMGGAFGGRVPCQASEEASLLSLAVELPVRVEWDRETEFAYNYFQPRFSHFIKAGVNDEGWIDYWQHDFVSSPIITGLVPDGIAWIMDKVVADKGTARGSLLPYHINNQRIRYSDIRTPVPVGAWRGLGAAPNTFAIESMIDQLAVAADIDPLSFRLKNLPPTQSRLAGVLKRVAEMAKWGTPSTEVIGRGIACVIYKNETYVAIIAEVEMEAVTKNLSIRKIYCAHDSGLVINPDQVENQIVGNIVWGCSMVLKEQITFVEGMVEQRNFDEYEFLRHSETPQIVIDLVKSNAPPAAVGESAFGPVAPAITNAIFALTGIRFNRLPVNFEN